MKRPGNPFPGLRPFRADEEPLFFGREAHVDRMVDALGATGFLAVVGSSGSGKSSLVTCGLVPALHRGLLSSRPGGWRVATCRPGNRPIRALAQALAEALAPAGVAPSMALAPGGGGAAGGTGFSPVALAEATLRASRRGLLDAWQEAGVASGAQPNLLVVVDQFEELFRYRGLVDAQADGDGSAARVAADGQAAEAVAFVNLLLEVPAQAALPVAVVITMRSDFLGECAQFHGLPEAINRGQFLVPRMTRDERRDAVRGPLAVCGAQIDPVLLNRLVNDVGDNPDQLSILQHALNRTWAEWQARGASGPVGSTHYDAVGTMEQALDRHADEALATLTAPGQAALCAAVFRAITDRGTDARGIRRPTRMDTLAAITGASADALAAVMAPFRDASRAFLMPPDGVALEPSTPVDISHESLMRVWTTLRGWTEAEAQSARIYRRLADSAALHAQGETDLIGPPELQVALAWRAREKPNRTWAERYSPGFDAAMAFLDASRADFEARQAAETDRQRAQAEAEARERRRRLNRTWLSWVAPAVLILGTTLVMVWNTSQQRERLEKATKSERDAATDRERELLGRIERLELELGRQRDAAQAQQARAASALAGSSAVTVDKLRSVMQQAQARPLVYLQFADERQRAALEKLRPVLQREGYDAPGMEKVRSVPGRNELRYFRTDDSGMAGQLVQLLQASGIGVVAPKLVTAYASTVKRPQFELWLALPADEGEPALLARQLDSADKPQRLAAGQALQSRYLGSPDAVAAVLGLLAADQIGSLSTDGRINALYYLSRTNAAAWTPALVQAARAALQRMDAGARGGTPVGAQTRAEMQRLQQLLDALPAGR